MQYIRFQHQGVTSLDLTTFDPLLFGSILTEGQDDFLTRIRPASVTQILPPKIPDMASYPDESFECPPISFEGPLSGGEEASLLEPPNNTTLCSFMDDLYAGLGCHAQAFVNAGVVSEHMVCSSDLSDGYADPVIAHRISRATWNSAGRLCERSCERSRRHVAVAQICHGI